MYHYFDVHIDIITSMYTQTSFTTVYTDIVTITSMYTQISFTTVYTFIFTTVYTNIVDLTHYFDVHIDIIYNCVHEYSYHYFDAHIDIIYNYVHVSMGK